MMSELDDVDGCTSEATVVVVDLVQPKASVGDVCDCADDVLTLSVRSLGTLECKRKPMSTQ